MPKTRNKNMRIRHKNQLSLWKKKLRKGDLFIAHTVLALCERMDWLEDHPVAKMAKEILKKYGKAKALTHEERLEPTQYKRLSKEELEKFFGKAKELTQHGDVIESIHRYDFKTCKCGRASVDGGHDYLR